MPRRIFIAGILFAALGILLRFTATPLCKEASFSRAVLDRNQRLLRLTLSSDEKYRLWTPLGNIAPIMIEATLLKEDRHFYRHFGVNPFSLVRSAWHTFIARDRRLGGSTLTMQLVRLRDRNSSKTIFGKLRQIAAAFVMEICHSKQEILEAYLNLAPYGLNIEGVGAASRIYFQKAPYRLGASEALSLAVLPQSPSLRAPQFTTEGMSYPAGLLRERELLAKEWGKAEETRLPPELHLPRELPFLAPHFVDDLIQRGIPPGETLSTLNLAHQRIVERQVRQWVERRRSVGIHNAVAMLLDTENMEVLAWVGSADYHNESIAGQVDGVTALRSPGSTLKPFLYGLALEQGHIHPLTMVKDAPARFGLQNPENFDRDFAGPLPAKEALNKSRNLPALWLNTLVAKPSLYEFLKESGMPLKEESFYGLGLALGNAETSMEKLVDLYSILPNWGKQKPLRRLLNEPLAPGKQKLSPEVAAVMMEMLEENPRIAQGFLDKLTRGSHPVAWKTGTSFAFRDAWSLGVVGRLVVAVWVGNFDGRGNPAFIGRDAAAPLLFGIIDAVRAQLGIPERVTPNGLEISRVQVCALSGSLPGPYCHHKVTTAFLPGKSPIKTCEIHREILVNERTGKRSCMAGAGTKPQVYEFWPSDLLRLFRLAGISRKVPPSGDETCPLNDRARRGSSPEITSPAKDLEYHSRISGPPDRIPLSAIADADVVLLHWFADGAYLGKSLPSEAFFWNPSPGRFAIRVVDDQGRSASREITVKAEE